MSQIKKLDQSTILKLAAGEIIDRPVSIVKELIENSIDAKASIIRISTTQGGIAEISVEDNGQGILNQDMMLALTPHATSKLIEFNDLESVLTMGFRGEALASMSEVAEVTIESYHNNDDIGAILQKKPGQDPVIKSKARANGTTITIAHLFKKIPVRFRFLKSPASEINQISRLVQQFSFHYPSIQFELRNNNALIYSTLGRTTCIEQCIEKLNFKKEDWLEFDKSTNGIRVSGAITTPNQRFKNRSKCWFSVNGRIVKSPMFFRALDTALIDLMPKQTYPAVVCNIFLNTNDVDINIHPKKEDVKFTDMDHVFIAIKRAIQAAFVRPAQTWQKALDQAQNHSSDIIKAEHLEFSPNIGERSAQNSFKSQSTPNQMSPMPKQIPLMTKAAPSKVEPAQPLISAKQSFNWVRFNNKFIIVPLNEELLIFDQHAVHERILYDQFKTESNANAIISMPLLVPEYIEFEASEVEAIRLMVPLIRSVGLDFEQFDSKSFVLRELPQFFSTVKIKTWLQEWLSSENSAELKSLDEIEKTAFLQRKACKAAVKAGQRLHDSEIQALIESCLNSNTQFTCPHGRPLYIKMTEQQLDKLFLRS